MTTNLTPERRDELRQMIANSHSHANYILNSKSDIIALLDAADERDQLIANEGLFSTSLTEIAEGLKAAVDKLIASQEP